MRPFFFLSPLPFLILLVLTVPLARADVVELVDGNKIEGQVIAKDSESITVQMTVNGRTFTRRWTLDKVRAVTAGDRTEASPNGPAITPAPPHANQERSREEVKALIDGQGRKKPDWWDSVALNYPRTLDLTWSDPPARQWDNQRYVGQYIWDIINPNPGKWRDGIRLVHHLLGLHKDNPGLRRRAMNELGRMYFDFYHDYARAAFWWQNAEIDDQDSYRTGVQLAECYWRLGSKPMALELLDKLPPQFSMIKAWAQMGELERALSLAEANASGPSADVALIYAGDACRVAGKDQQALEYYQKVLQLQPSGRARNRILANQQRAKASSEAVRLFASLDLKRIPDGTYRGSSLGYQDQLWVEVTVRSSRIESVNVIQHQEKQFFNAMTETPQKIIAKQSVQGIDATSGATLTSQAIIQATAKALASGVK